MTEQHRPSYVALVAAMRAEFLATALESLWIQMREHRHNTSSLGLLAQAVHDAQDLAYDAGESPAESRAKVDELTAELGKIADSIAPTVTVKPVSDAVWFLHGLYKDWAAKAHEAQAKVDELTAALAKETDLKERYARTAASVLRQRDNHAAQADRFSAALAEKDAQLTAANRRNGGLQADLDSATKANTAWANENAELRTALLDVAKTGGVTHVWDRQSTDWVPVAKFAATKAEVAR